MKSRVQKPLFFLIISLFLLIAGFSIIVGLSDDSIGKNASDISMPSEDHASFQTMIQKSEKPVYYIVFSIIINYLPLNK